MSGLTVGYLSIDELSLELKLLNGSNTDKINCCKIQNLLKSKHRLLVTLLVSNAAAMEALPLFLDKLVPSWLAVVLSTTLVLFVGEIIPQSVCTGPRQLEIAAGLAGFTKVLMIILYPINEPLRLLLDYLFEESEENAYKNRYVNSDLQALINLHTIKSLKFDNTNNNSNNNNNNSSIKEDFGLDEDQANFMISSIEAKNIKVKHVLIPIDKTFVFDYDKKIDYDSIKLIDESGFSRIPVYINNNKKHIIGIVRIKQLIKLDISLNKSLREHGVQVRKPLLITDELSLINLLKEFKKGTSHMAFVTNNINNYNDYIQNLIIDNDINNKNTSLPINYKDSKSFKINNKLYDAKYNHSIEVGNELNNLMNKNNIFKSEDVIKSKSTGKINVDTDINTNIDQQDLLGIVTLEDVLEKVFNIDILDEDDYEKYLIKNYFKDNKTTLTKEGKQF